MISLLHGLFQQVLEISLILEFKLMKHCWKLFLSQDLFRAATQMTTDLFLQVPESFVESDAFLNMATSVKKIFLFSVWVKVILAKYISLWLLSEGTVILSGKVKARSTIIKALMYWPIF